MESNDTAKEKESAQVEEDQGSSPQGIFLPMAILMISVLLFLGWQLYLMKAQGAIWKQQFAQREQMVNQSRAVQSDLQRVAFELISLSQTDHDARVLIDKYQIKQESNLPAQNAGQTQAR